MRAIGRVEPWNRLGRHPLLPCVVTETLAGGQSVEVRPIRRVRFRVSRRENVRAEVGAEPNRPDEQRRHGLRMDRRGPVLRGPLGVTEDIRSGESVFPVGANQGVGVGQVRPVEPASCNREESVGLALAADPTGGNLGAVASIHVVGNAVELVDPLSVKPCHPQPHESGVYDDGADRQLGACRGRSLQVLHGSGHVHAEPDEPLRCRTERRREGVEVDGPRARDGGFVKQGSQIPAAVSDPRDRLGVGGCNAVQRAQREGRYTAIATKRFSATT